MFFVRSCFGGACMLSWGRSRFRRFSLEEGASLFDILVRELAFFEVVCLGFVGVGFWVAGFECFWGFWVVFL